MSEGWLDRVVAERNELQQRMDRLALFIEGDEFASLGTEERRLLQRQLVYMSNYCSILQQRIELSNG